MARAFVFANIDPGSEIEVLKSLRDVPQIKEAYFVYGVYDVVAKVEAESMDELKEIISSKIRRLDKIRSTLTTIVHQGKYRKFVAAIPQVWGRGFRHQFTGTYMRQV